MGSEWIAPTITGVLAVLTTIIAVVVAAKNAKSTSREQRAPDVNEAWEEANRARKRAYLFEDMFHTVKAALKNLMRSLVENDETFEIPKDVRHALELQAPPDDHK